MKAECPYCKRKGWL